jgi:DNA (cytosine-5)-methyltransferase 1
MNCPLALDLFCCAGGATKGLQRAGFEVVGVDHKPQPRYCGDHFVQADALRPPFDLAPFDFIWASPPCQPFTALKSVFDASKYEDLIEPTRHLLARHPVTVLENVPGAPIRRDLILCANAFGLRSYRHRWFEMSFFCWQPGHPPHRVRVNRKKMRRKEHWEKGGFATVIGDIGRYIGPEAMGIDWMSGDELSQAIPPAYSEFIGRAALAQIERRAA